MTKVIVTNGSALAAKYGANAADVLAAVHALIAADSARGVTTQLVRLDDASGPAGSSAVTAADDGAQNKRAVDAVFAALSPDYLMLLGGPDVIAHCTLENAMRDEDGDTLASDLPYACDAPSSAAVEDYLAPTRVVSRVPDVPGAATPDVLIRMLQVAAGAQGRSRSDYEAHLGISAEDWEASTALTLTQLFGTADGLELSPTEGPNWSTSQLAPRTHFINCHGAPSSPQYQGQQGPSYPVAHDAALIDGGLTEGTVLAAECCYGAEIYEPVDGRLGIALTYLNCGAYAVFGSTTVAYGPVDSNASADLICRFFVASTLTGASVGRAGLEARQSFISGSSPLDPADLKTLAQFIVLGDPSIHPVATGPEVTTRGPARGASERGARRADLEQKGRAIGRTAAYAVRMESRPRPDIEDRLIAFAGMPGGQAKFASFDVRGGVKPKGIGVSRGAEPAPLHIHLLLERLEIPHAPMPQQIAVIAVEERGQFTSIQTLVSR